jgi:hypothetical protein
MIVAKQLAQFLIGPLAMAVAVALSLWVLLGLLHIGQPAAYTVPEPVALPASTPEPEPRGSGTAGPSLVPSDSRRLVTPALRDALANKGYLVDPAAPDGSDNALTALGAFQDNEALPVQPKCDRQCRIALGLPGAE